MNDWGEKNRNRIKKSCLPLHFVDNFLNIGS